MRVGFFFFTILMACLGLSLLPFGPGSYDPLVLPLATSIQLFEVGWLLAILPAGIGVLRGGTRWHQRYWLVTSGVMVVVGLVSAAGVSKVLGGIWLLLALGIFWSEKKRIGYGSDGRIYPLVLLLLPLSCCGLTAMLSGPLTQWSRHRAMDQAEELITALKRYRTQQGVYPHTLQAVWPDYATGVIGVAQYHYAGTDHTYQLFFEQPRYLFDDFGVRELVVYCPTAEHFVVSHASWPLLLSPQQLRQTPGWHANLATGRSHWRILRFD